MSRCKAVVALCLVATVVFPPAFAEGQAAVATVKYTVNQDGERALSLDEYARAETIFSSALNDSGLTRENRGYLRLGLGESLMWQGKMKEAAAAFKKALPDVDAAFPPQDNMRARLYDDLSWLSQAQGFMDKARGYCEQALEIRRKHQAASPDAFVTSLAHMGYLYDQQGLSSKAAACYEEALPVQAKMTGDNSIPVADLKERLASAYRRLGRADDAARLFNEALSIKFASSAVTDPYSPHESWTNVTYRYLPGAPNCFRKLDQGDDYEVTVANGVTVAAAVTSRRDDPSKSVRVDIVLRNETGSPVQFLPRPPELISLEPKVEVAHQVDPAKLASTVEKRGDRKAAWIKFWGADATQSVTTTVIGRPGWWGYPPIYSSGVAPPVITRQGDFTTITTQVPDYQKRAEALARAADAIDRSRAGAENIRARALGPTSVSPGRTLNGSLYFDARSLQKSVLRIPVGNAVFEFRFPAQ